MPNNTDTTDLSLDSDDIHNSLFEDDISFGDCCNCDGGLDLDLMSDY